MVSEIGLFNIKIHIKLENSDIQDKTTMVNNERDNPCPQYLNLHITVMPSYTFSTDFSSASYEEIFHAAYHNLCCSLVSKFAHFKISSGFQGDYTINGNCTSVFKTHSPR
jgi:hypothetical protein